MPISVVMPALEMAQETGKLIAWLKKEGQSVSKGEPLLEIETDKAVMEIESPGDGLLGGIKAREGAEIPVGQTIAWILRPGESIPAEEAQPESARHHDTPAATASAAPSELPPESPASDVRMSPKARRLAKENGVDLSKIKGSGPAGEILASDVLAAAEVRVGETAHKSESGASTTIQTSPRLSAIERLMAERTTQSWTTVPHFFVTREIDASGLLALREEFANQNGQATRPTHSDVLVALVARVLTKHPALNASWTGDGIRNNPEINIALATAVEDGVVAPVIAKADKADFWQIATVRKELTERARAGKLHPQDLSGGTFTISNLGMFNVDAFTAIILAPQAAILAVGRIADRVIVVDGQPAVRPMISCTLSVDHRVADGARAARFLDDLAQAMTNPGKWLQLH
jgi:pyruvate dehydrogenase E2 component (dihydrolipoamide acetyltransferase)